MIKSVGQEFLDTDIEKTLYPAYTQLAHVLVQWQDQLLLLHREADPFKGYWTVPGGNVEHGETYKLLLKEN